VGCRRRRSYRWYDHPRAARSRIVKRSSREGHRLQIGTYWCTVAATHEPGNQDALQRKAKVASSKCPDWSPATDSHTILPYQYLTTSPENYWQAHPTPSTPGTALGKMMKSGGARLGRRASKGNKNLTGNGMHDSIECRTVAEAVLLRVPGSGNGGRVWHEE
jgi:hypothetical protein